MATVTTTPTPAGARREATAPVSRTISPRVDIYETDKTYVLLADMPGIAPGGLTVETERDTLIIRGRVSRPDRPPDYQEFELADYARTFVLTEDLEPDGITASLRDGVLRVAIPKSTLNEPKKIPVRTE